MYSWLQCWRSEPRYIITTTLNNTKIKKRSGIDILHNIKKKCWFRESNYILTGYNSKCKFSKFRFILHHICDRYRIYVTKQVCINGIIPQCFSSNMLQNITLKLFKKPKCKFEAWVNKHHSHNWRKIIHCRKLLHLTAAAIISLYCNRNSYALLVCFHIPGLKRVEAVISILQGR